MVKMSGRQQDEWKAGSQIIVAEKHLAFLCDNVCHVSAFAVLRKFFVIFLCPFVIFGLEGLLGANQRIHSFIF